MPREMCLNGDSFAPLPLRKAYLKNFALKDSVLEREQHSTDSRKLITNVSDTQSNVSSSQHSLERFKLRPRLVDEAREYIRALDEQEFKRRHMLPSEAEYSVYSGSGQRPEGRREGDLEQKANISLLLKKCGISLRDKISHVGIFDGCSITLNSSSLMSCDACPSKTKSGPSVSLKGLHGLIFMNYQKLLYRSNMNEKGTGELAPLEALVTSLEEMLTTSMDSLETAKARWSQSEEFSNCWWHDTFRQASFLRRLLCPLTIDCQKCGTISQLFDSFSKDGTDEYKIVSCQNHESGNVHGVSLLHALIGIPDFAPVVFSSLEAALVQSGEYAIRCQSPVSVHQAASLSPQNHELDVYNLIVSQLQTSKSIQLSSQSAAVLDRILDELSSPRKGSKSETLNGPSKSLPRRRINEKDALSQGCQKLFRLSNSGEVRKRNSLLRRGMKRILERTLEENAAPPLRKKMNCEKNEGTAIAAVKEGVASKALLSRSQLEEYLQHRRQLLKQVQQLKTVTLTTLESLKQKEQCGVVIETPMRSSGRQAKAVSQERATSNAEIFLDSSDISREDFIATTIYLHDVHRLFQKRSIVEGKEPRMPLKHIKVSETVQKRLHDILFNEDGSLRPGIINDIDVSTENDPRFINFGNNAKTGRKDLRFQVGLRKQMFAGGAPIPTREKINDLFVELGVIDPDHESLHEIGILIGGTEDQSLHHDCARRFVRWYPQPITGKENERELSDIPGVLDGFEVDVLRYNTVMSSPYAPSSMLVALGNEGEMFVGVQKDRILRRSVGSKRCVIDGADNVEYEIIRETDMLVVLRVEGGVIFTGDFPHCGVRNVGRGTPEEVLVDDLNQKIQTILEDFSARQRVSRSKAVVDMLCRFPGLDKLSRLHCSTQTHDCGISIPFNMIGYASCLMNKRDDRCHEEERNNCVPMPFS